MQVTKRALSLILALMLLIGLTACGAPSPETDETKTFTFTVVDGNKKETVFTIETTEEKLADALLDEGIITEKASDGYYTTIGGITADYSKDQSWWCINQNGAMASYGLNDLVIKDGDSFEAVYTIG